MKSGAVYPAKVADALRRALVPALLAGTTALSPPSLAAQNTHILLVSGLGGDLEYSAAFHAWLSRFADAATERHGVPASRIVYLGERADLDPTRIRARSTAENVRDAIADLGAAMAPNDELVVLLVGHGTYRNGAARFNLPGPDLSPEDLGGMLDGLGPRRVAVINAATASGPFVPALSAPNRTVIAATRSGMERNLTRFGLHFVDAFASGGADLDKDGRVSMLEAFGYARREVEREYEGGNLLLTEHAVLDDNGDGEGSRDAGGAGGGGGVAGSGAGVGGAAADGALARTVFLMGEGAGAEAGGGGGEVSERVRELLRDKAAIEARIEELRAVKAQMPLERYEDELEALLVELALKNREIRAAGG